MDKADKYKRSGILLSKRSNVFYLEHARVMQKNERIVFFLETGDRVEQAFNLPDKNTMFLLLGKGTSITDAAIRKLSESNVMVGFCGSGGSPSFCASDFVFLPTQDEYRPTEYAQAWIKKWFEPNGKEWLAVKMMKKRMERLQKIWLQKGLELDEKIIDRAKDVLSRDSLTIPEIMSAEAHMVKALYIFLAKKYKVDFVRDKTLERNLDSSQHLKTNEFLTYGNYISYGFSASALHVLGIPYCFPALHGNTRRGALVFDTADLIKDGLVLPLAFDAANRDIKDKNFRLEIIEEAHQQDIMDYLIESIKDICSEI